MIFFREAHRIFRTKKESLSGSLSFFLIRLPAGAALLRSSR